MESVQLPCLGLISGSATVCVSVSPSVSWGWWKSPHWAPSVPSWPLKSWGHSREHNRHNGQVLDLRGWRWKQCGLQGQVWLGRVGEGEGVMAGPGLYSERAESRWRALCREEWWPVSSRSLLGCCDAHDFFAKKFVRAESHRLCPTLCDPTYCSREV